MSFILTVPQLLRIMPRSAPVIAAWVGPLEQAQLAFGITNAWRVACFLSNFAMESAELTKLEEDLRYRSGDRLKAVFTSHFASPEEAQRYVDMGPEAIANRVYSNRMGNGSEASGDGWRYRGRVAGLTFKNNYRDCGKVICNDAAVLVNDPDLVTDPEFGAAAAGWHWDANGCNPCADNHDFDGCCDLTNIGHKTVTEGDANGYADRRRYFEAACKEVGITP